MGVVRKLIGLFSLIWVAGIQVSHAQTAFPLDETSLVYYDIGFNACSNDSWKLVFSDEFNGTQLKTQNWYTYFPFTADGSATEVQCRTESYDEDHHLECIYRDQNVSVSNGFLTLAARQGQDTWYGVTRPYTSGVIYSKAPFKFKQGSRAEIRCKIPYGLGLMSAFWAWSDSEIDFFEICGNETDVVKYSIHQWDGGHVSTSRDVQTLDLSTGFHTFFSEWDGNIVRYGEVVNGVDLLYYYYTRVYDLDEYDTFIVRPHVNCNISPGPYHELDGYPNPQDMSSIIVNLAVVDAGWFCHEDPVFSGQKDLIVDYVRMYQRVPGEGLVDLCSDQYGIQGYPSAVCPNTQTTFNYFGPHGNLSWSCSPNLVITSSSQSSVTVLHSGSDSQWGWVAAQDDDPPCPFNATHHRNVWIGGPLIESVTYDQVGCTDEVEVHVTTAPYNNEERYYWLDNEFQATDCDGQHYTHWHLQEDFSYCPPGADFCSTLRVEVRSVCEDYPATYQGPIHDNCIIGPCDLADPDLPDRLRDELTVAPTPASDSFDLMFSGKVDLTIIKEVFVWNSSFTKLFTVVHPTVHSVHVDCSSWPSGLYYASFKYEGEQIVSKIQIK